MTEADFDLFWRIGVGPELLGKAGVRRVTDREARDECGLEFGRHADLSGLAFPRCHPITGDVRAYRVRRDHPEIDLSTGRPRAKYVGSRDRQAWFFPGKVGAERLAGTCTLKDGRRVSVPAVLVEAEKSCLSVEAAWRALKGEIDGRSRGRVPLLPIALGGIYGWRGRVGKTTTASGARVDEHGTVPDFDLVTWRDRDVVLCLDANVAARPDLIAAERGLAAELRRRGARVFIARVPAEPGINGPDDYAAAHGLRALLDLLAEATLWLPPGELGAEAFCATFQLDAAALAGVSLGQLEERLRDAARELRGVDALRLKTITMIVKANANKAGLKGTAGLIDAALTAQPEPTADEDEAFLKDDEPWPEPVAGADVLDGLLARIKRHVVMDEHAAVAAALWAALSYASDYVSILPLLLLESATKRSGKTTLLTTESALVRRGLPLGNMTGPTMFRVIEQYRPTLLLDEVDEYLSGDDNGLMTSLINSGHTRMTARVPRCVGDDHEIGWFSTWCPKLLCGIKKYLKDTVLDRSIRIVMHRKATADRVERIRIDLIHGQCAPLRQQTRRWVDEVGEHLRGADPAMPAGLHDRAMDNWRPLIALADLAGEEWPTRARSAAVALSGVDEDEPLGVQLLGDLREAFGDAERLPTQTALEHLHGLDERPWATFKHDRPINAHGLARLLRPFGIRPTTYKNQSGLAVKGYVAETFREAWSRYLPSSKRNFVTEPVNIDEIDDSKRNQDSERLRIESTKTPMNTGPVTKLRIEPPGMADPDEEEEEIRV